MTTLGENIIALRAELDITRAQLARRTGILPQTLADIEYGRVKMPAYDKVVALAAALGVTPERLCPLKKPSKITRKKAA